MSHSSLRESFHLSLTALILVARAGLLSAQTPSRLSISGTGQTAETQQPSVPPDPLELVTGDAEPIQDVDGRAEIVTLFNNAHRHSNVRAQPYDLKTTFTSSGSGAFDGSWQLQDTSPGRSLYRWTAQGPSYSVVSLYVNKILYSNRNEEAMPIRLAQTRAAIFFTHAPFNPRASIRKATATLDGTELVCALVSQGISGRAVSGGRSWDEAEYCAEPKSASIVTYSPIPGSYIRYDYSKPIHFHDTVMPGGFTISQAGQTIVEAQITSVTDPPDDLSAFKPDGLNKIGLGPTMTAPWHYHMTASGASKDANASPQVVVIHGMLSPKGKLSDTELIASSDPSLNSSALQYAAKWKAGPMGQLVEPRAKPQSHEVFLSLEYAPPQH